MGGLIGLSKKTDGWGSGGSTNLGLNPVVLVGMHTQKAWTIKASVQLTVVHSLNASLLMSSSLLCHPLP